MPGIDHQAHQEDLGGIEDSHHQVYQDEFHGTGKNLETHEHGVPEGEPGSMHPDSIGEPQEQEAGQDGQGMGKGTAQGLDPPVPDKGRQAGDAGTGKGKRAWLHDGTSNSYHLHHQHIMENTYNQSGKCMHYKIV